MNSDKESEDFAKDLIQELENENHTHLNILLYLVIIVIIIDLICASAYFVKNKNNILPYDNYINRRQLQQVPTETNEQRFKDPAHELYNLYSTYSYPKLTPTHSVPV